MKQLDKLKNKIKVEKHLLVFFIILLLIGVSMGAIFVTILNTSDKALINEYLNQFLDNIQNNKIDFWIVFKNNLWNMLLIVSIIWLLGISVIGIPIVVILFFIKTFTLGFSIGSILLTFKAKGIIFTLFYIFPGQIFSLLALLLLSMYSISFSLKLIHSIVKKKTIDFKVMANRYFFVFLIVVGVSLLMVLYDTYGMPFLVRQIITWIR